MSKPSRSRANIPIHRESLSCLLSPVFCLLSPISYLLSPVFCILSYLCLRVFVVTSQLCKTNPIRKTTESPQPLLPQRLTLIFAFTPVEKTNPNKPNPATPGKHRESSIQHQVSSPVYAKQTQFQNGQYKHKYSKHKGLCQRIRQRRKQSTTNVIQNKAKTNPILAQYAIRNTQYDIPHAIYEIRDTLHASRDSTSCIHPLPIARESAIIQPLKNPNLQRQHIWPTI